MNDTRTEEVRRSDFLQARRRSRRWVIVGAAIIVAFALTFSGLTVKALSIRSNTSSEFSKYVITHNIGHSEVSDDSSGLESDFCVLYLNQPISDAELTPKVLSLFQVYNQLDGGDSLTVEYTPTHGKVQIEADVELLNSGTAVAIIEHLQSGKTVSMQRPVSWQVGSGSVG